MIESLLIANRGEIACRIIRTARAMGVRTVAVYSDADANALHVRQADQAVHIGPSPARESYLVGERVIAAAKSSGAAAIHPGYGFLSENADFAQAVIDAGLIWVGPSPGSIRAMGLKDAAKERMIAAGVPVTPGYLGEDQLPERLQKEADAIGYPVLIKAVAGGGGKGMRRVDAAQQFDEMLQSCKREAASSFGDDRVLIEKYILSPRHIEVQVFGDTHGNVVHLFERDCSLQRRHQKVIEEAPAPGMDETTRETICAAALRAAKAVDYVGAGTIEFIADASEGLRADRIWFMEMNTRLQVEHPVTEEITGVDLVEWQLRVASGEPIPLRQDELAINGWAIEARLYAEDPSNGFLPSVGPLTHFNLPSSSQRNPNRVETGVTEGQSISADYDPMIAKLIVHRSSRSEALDALARICALVICWPVRTNSAFLTRLLRNEAVQSAQLDTGLIAMRAATVIPPVEAAPELVAGAAHAILMRGRRDPYLYDEEALARRPLWDQPNGFRLNRAPRPLSLQLTDGSRSYESVPDENRTWIIDSPNGVLATLDGDTRMFRIARTDGAASGTATDGAILSPMPGRVTAVDVAAGDTVTTGQRLVTLEAMKMEHSLTAPFDGTVAELNAEAGAQVTEGALLVRIEKAE
ncbi:acetyl/propionyl/methylcrotonyl-CoA carboxylase subunit alpha [Sphingomonas sp.]|jgi:3-methylcrotonyl-CoA carboxylase alpha subunit|uniref:acetyl/propionyl/methylcrotonyl-CoA carboxylase subunit alpha n=1 Tax=Sphingomonas sp. TaxID=28214 RepID=UPI002ED818FA